jgi:hypothetical protein
MPIARREADPIPLRPDPLALIRVRMRSLTRAVVGVGQKALSQADRNLKLAAEYLAFAEEKGKTQRQMAECAGKSPYCSGAAMGVAH